MTKALTRVPSGGGTSRTLCNIEERDDTVGQPNSDDTVGKLNSDETAGQLNTSGQLNLGGGLESLAASIKEDFSRLNRNGGLDLAPNDQVT